MMQVVPLMNPDTDFVSHLLLIWSHSFSSTCSPPDLLQVFCTWIYVVSNLFSDTRAHNTERPVEIKGGGEIKVTGEGTGEGEGGMTLN